jgi:hypothetical protein
LSASGEAGAEREEKERNREDEGFHGRARDNRHVKLCPWGKGAPIIGKWECVHCGV